MTHEEQAEMFYKSYMIQISKLNEYKEKVNCVLREKAQQDTTIAQLKHELEQAKKKLKNQSKDYDELKKTTIIKVPSVANSTSTKSSEQRPMQVDTYAQGLTT